MIRFDISRRGFSALLSTGWAAAILLTVLGFHLLGDALLERAGESA